MSIVWGGGMWTPGYSFIQTFAMEFCNVAWQDQSYGDYSLVQTITISTVTSRISSTVKRDIQCTTRFFLYRNTFYKNTHLAEISLYFKENVWKTEN